MRKRSVCIIFLLFCVLFTACNSQSIENPDQLQKFIDKYIALTQKAVEGKDIKLAREIWSKITEYGLKAKEMDKKELADSLGKLAATYSYLVEYINTGDKTQLSLFEDNFNKAVYLLREYVSFKSR